MSDSQKWFVFASLAGVGWLLYLLSPTLTPFVAGALLAYLSDPLVDRLEAKGLKRTPSVIVVFAAVTLIAALALLVLLPLLERQIDRLVENLPSYAAWVKGKLLPWLKGHYGLHLQLGSLDQVTALLGKNWQQAGGLAASMIDSLSRSGSVVLTWMMNLLLIPVVTFYLLRDWDVMMGQIGDLLPRRLAPTIGKLAAEADEVLSAFLRGQFSVMLALGLIYSIGLWIVDLDLALLIGVIAGLVSFIPYMGFLVGLLSACAAALVQFGEVWPMVHVLIVFAIGQTLEGTLLTPKLVGDRIGLHPVAVIFAVLAGGQLFGFLGVLLALPTASVIMVLIRHAHDLYKGSNLYGLAETPDEPPQE
ncbi:MAG: AI-2E family transporter [Methylococcaceae bacterium]|nr:AI-2E family transporter [Methylococcaceae bacterium]